MYTSPYLIDFCRLFIFLILIFSFLGKGLTFRKFKENLTKTLPMPKPFVTALAILVVGIEGLLAIVILLNNEFTYTAMQGALILFTMFTLFISITVIQDRLVKCNCFGQSEEYITYLDIIRNITLLVSCCFFLNGHQDTSVPKPIQILLLGMALTAYLIITNLKNIQIMLHNLKNK